MGIIKTAVVSATITTKSNSAIAIRDFSNLCIFYYFKSFLYSLSSFWIFGLITMLQ